MSAAGAAFLAALLVATIGLAAARERTPPPRPLPQPPATGPAPAPQPPAGSAPSPLLLQHGPATPPRAGAKPSYPQSSYPAPIDQQKLQSYRSELLNERRRLENRGVSPGSGRYREIQQQLNQLDRRR